MQLAQSSAVFRPFVRLHIHPVIRMTAVSVAPATGPRQQGYVCGAVKAGENLTHCISAPVYQDMSASRPSVTVTDPYNPAEVQVEIDEWAGGHASKKESCDRVFHHYLLRVQKS